MQFVWIMYFINDPSPFSVYTKARLPNTLLFPDQEQHEHFVVLSLQVDIRFRTNRLKVSCILEATVANTVYSPLLKTCCFPFSPAPLSTVLLTSLKINFLAVCNIDEGHTSRES